VQDLLHRIFSQKVLESRSMGGGDISQAYLVRTQDQQIFLKLNHADQALAMYETEASGLARLGSVDGVSTPEVVRVGVIDGTAFIAMQFVQSSHPSAKYWRDLAENLASIHKTTGAKFGLDHHNFIGSLIQSNHQVDDWAAFFDLHRLRPQIQMAIENNLLDKSHMLSLEDLVKRLPEICPDEPPALVHGDLWAGNKICGPNQKAFFIDPAIAFAHREMDLAMAKLFGGFDPLFFDHYQQLYPLVAGFASRCNVYQLYYLLVHLNLFGQSYYPQVNSILKQYD